MAKIKDQQRSTKHYTENQTLSHTNPTENRGWTQVPRKGLQFLFYKWHIEYIA